MNIIIDTNIWVSFVIGKRLCSLREILTDERVQLFVCAELKYEFFDVVARPKIKKIVKNSDIIATKKLMDAYCKDVEIIHKAPSFVRDPKDVYLLSLAETVNADYIVTGDNDLLALGKHNKTLIVTYSDFFALL